MKFNSSTNGQPSSIYTDSSSIYQSADEAHATASQKRRRRCSKWSDIVKEDSSRGFLPSPSVFATIRCATQVASPTQAHRSCQSAHVHCRRLEQSAGQETKHDVLEHTMMGHPIFGNHHVLSDGSLFSQVADAGHAHFFTSSLSYFWDRRGSRPRRVGSFCVL